VTDTTQGGCTGIFRGACRCYDREVHSTRAATELFPGPVRLPIPRRFFLAPQSFDVNA